MDASPEQYTASWTGVLPQHAHPNRAQRPREPVRFDTAPSPTALIARVEGDAPDAEVAER
jgi:hypothetical protein